MRLGVFKLSVAMVAVTAVAFAGCMKKVRPPAGSTGTAQSSPAAETVPPSPPSSEAPPTPPSAPVPAETALEPSAETPKTDARIPPELARIMVLAQKHALSTGQFPSSWDELIAAKIISQPPKGKNGQPMTWKEFLQAIDP
jgi:hypothetical protein